MRWIGFFIVLGVLGFGTLGALVASAAGWGLEGTLDKPVSIRQESVGGRGPRYYYFGGIGRRHSGGGFFGGK
ncbi:MAG: hypothetical protein IT371_13710 [Deltaproteobacteria bacterium]|nr:hypothetical protein [Deltaproteobacteria bacterium]